jgi:transposase
MIEAILWKHRTGAPWRDLPAEFGSWNSVFCRFNRWSKVGLWQTILEVLRIEADTEWLMIDATIHGFRGGHTTAIVQENPHRI